MPVISVSRNPMPASLIPNIPGISDGIESAFNTVLDSIMKAIWSASVWLLRTALELIDGFLSFNTNLAGVDGRPAAGAPFAMLWPTLMWIAGAIALGLFFWQLAVTVLRGGVGFWRVASGPVAFGVACALSLGVVTVLLGGADGLTKVLLEQGLSAENFVGILDGGAKLGKVLTDSPPDLGDQVDGTARSVVLGIVSVFALIPAAIGYLLEMVFRQAIVLVLVATLPITAAGLMTNTTSSWFWRALRWTIAAIILKPALALVLVIGVNMLGQPSGIGGLLSGAGVLLVSLFCPLAVFRLLAFVEPGTAAGTTFRSSLSSASSGSGSAGAADAGSSAEDSNTSRFDSAGGGGGGGSGGSSGSGSGVSQLGGLVGGAAAAATSFGNAQMDGAGIGWGYGGPAGGGNSNNGNQNQSRSQQDPNSSGSGDSSAGGAGSAPVDGGLPVSPDSASQAIAPPTPGSSPVGAGSGSTGGGGGPGGPGGGGGAAAAADVPPVA